MNNNSFQIGSPLPLRHSSTKENRERQGPSSTAPLRSLRTIRPVQNLRSCDQETSILVSPIRSMSIRGPPHHPSATRLHRRNQPSTYLSRDPVIITTHGAIRKAVDQLQGIHDVPIKKTLRAAEVQEATSQIPDSRPKTPPKITRRLTEYLENAQGRKSLSAEEIERAVSGRIAKTLTSNIVATRDSAVPLTDEDVHDTETRPVPRTIPSATPISMELNVEHNQLSAADGSQSEEAQTMRQKSQVHWEVPVATSRRSNVSHRSTFQATFPLGLPPALRLNGNDLSSDKCDQLEEDEIFLKPPLDRDIHFTRMFGEPRPDSGHSTTSARQPKEVDLRGRSHVDLPGRGTDRENYGSCSHNPSARNWRITRKRLTATVACINSSCIGLLIGVYAGEVPGIQYRIIDLNHYIILGNVLLYLGLALSTLLFWPLPLLHGRRPYTVASLILTLCLQIPQGIAKVLLLVSRATSGLVLGLCDMNVQGTLLDLFGASLQTRTSSQEIVNPFDIRRHGGGMGLWLGIWSFCSIGPISLGFMIGASIISSVSVTWGFWFALMILMMVLLLNVISPELRRSAFRRTAAEMTGLHGDYCTIARGEIKMHVDGTGPAWWGQEIYAGWRLSKKMLHQPGFLVLSLYSAWVYAQYTFLLMFLGALLSTDYHLVSTYVGLGSLSLGFGSLLAVPFQKASWFSRYRWRPATSNSMTIHQRLKWTSHLVRRSLLTILLPITAVAYLLVSHGPPLSPVVPCIMTILVGFFSALAIAECYGIILETFDTSDLQPGMTSRPARNSVIQRDGDQWTNFSCYPRISAGIAVIQALKYALAAAATGTCGRIQKRFGAMQATAVVAGVLLLMTILLALVLIRWRTVRLAPDSDPDREVTFRKSSIWKPIKLGQHDDVRRKISILESGRMTRWSEIRLRNKIHSGLTG